MRIGDNLTSLPLPKNVIKAGDGHAVGHDEVAEHIPGAHRRQLVGIPHQHQVCFRRQAREQRMEQPKPSRRGMVLASSPVLSAIRLAARPVGAASVTV